MTRGSWPVWHLDSAGCRLHLALRPGRAESWRTGLRQLPSASLTPCRCPAAPPVVADTDWAASPQEYATDGLTLQITRDGSWPDVRRLLNGVLHCLQLGRGRLTLHATAVGQGDGAVLLLGGHGVGKTLTSLHLARRGWPVLAGDTAVVNVDGATLVGGTQVVLARPYGLADQLPELARAARRELTPGEPRVDVSALVPLADPAERAGRRLLGVVVLQPGDDDPAVLRMAAARRLRSALYQSSAHQLDREVDALDLPLRLIETPELLRRRITLCRALCDRVPVSEVAAAPRLVAELLARRDEPVPRGA